MDDLRQHAIDMLQSILELQLGTDMLPAEARDAAYRSYILNTVKPILMEELTSDEQVGAMQRASDNHEQGS